MNWKKLDQSGGVSRVSVESFLSLIAEIFRRGILHCCIISGTEKVWIGGGDYQDFRSKVYVSQCGKFLWGNPSLLH